MDGCAVVTTCPETMFPVYWAAATKISSSTYMKLRQYYYIFNRIPWQYIALCIGWYILHSQCSNSHIDVYTLENAPACCFSEANITEISCNVTISGLSTTVRRQIVQLQLEPTDHNLVCNQSVLSVEVGEHKYIYVHTYTCVCIIYQFGLTYLNIKGTLLP